MDSDDQSNADSFATALPVHTQTGEDDRISTNSESSQERESHANETRGQVKIPPENREGVFHSSPCRPEHITPQGQNDDEQPTPHNAIQARNVTLVGARPCSILLNQTATWLVKRKKMALSSLAAAVLVREGLIEPQQLELSVTFPMTQRAY
jgi:hypothetical protein